MLDLETFVHSQIPLIIKGQPRMTAVLATYNVIRGFEPGPVPFCPDGLEVHLRQLETYKPEDPTQLAAAGVPIFVAVYMGMSSSFRAANYGLLLTKDRPGSTLVVVACPCPARGKEEALRLAKEGASTHVIDLPDCGDSHAMRTIMKALVFKWPDR